MGSILAQRFRQEVSKHKDFRMKNESEFEVGYPTGFLNFDFLNGCIVHVKHKDGSSAKYYSIGIIDGTMVAVIGRSTGGKSTWIMQTSANIIRPYKTSCIFEDSTEGGLTQTRKETLARMSGTDLKERMISRNTGITAENFYERIKMIHDMKVNNRSDYEYDTGLYDTLGQRIYKLEPTIYILDSIAVLMPEKFTEEEELSGNSAAMMATRVVTGIMKRIVPMLKTANIILFVVNHILDDAQLTMMPKKGQLAYLKQGERLPEHVA